MTRSTRCKLYGLVLMTAVAAPLPFLSSGPDLRPFTSEVDGTPRCLLEVMEIGGDTYGRVHAAHGGPISPWVGPKPTEYDLAEWFLDWSDC